MKFKLFAIISIQILLLQATKIFSQAVIDYQNISPSNCNIFSPSITVNSISHKTVSGQPAYNTTNKSVILKCDYTSNFNKGTKYKLLYPFKQGYTYKITINAKNMTTAAFGNIYDQIGLYMDNDNSLTNGNSLCNGPEVVSLTGSVLTINPDFFVAYDFNFSTLSSNYSTFYIYSTPIIGCLPIIQNIEIKKITITETPPPPTFTLAPATLNVTIGTSVSQTFTVTNVYSTAGVTGYTWNLGATPNGWKYLGAAAPATINTTANTLALQTDICATTIKSVSAVAKIGVASYTTNSSVVTAIAPVYTITGPPRVCAGIPANYSINAPVGSTVNWAVSPAGIVTPPNPVTGLSTTLNKVADGTCTLTANVSRNGCASTPFTIPLSTATPSTSSVITWTRSSSCSNGFQTWNLTADNTRGSNWLWSVGSLSANSQILIFNPNGSQTLADVKGTGAIKLNYTDICGVATQDGVTVFTTCPPTFLVAPNPATDNVVVTTDNTATEKIASPALIYKIKITDRMGGIRKLADYKTPIRSIAVSTKGLESGIYTISIYDGTLWSSQKLIVK